ncbi:hypothetical protein V5O48_009769 [Marasmius crinis-equi]|uniref:Uncharacterized protein n=1 Tax=Marasmius crinis-equi TaxID=585013 RepID=A0ABR3FAL8_9AGAR
MLYKHYSDGWHGEQVLKAVKSRIRSNSERIFESSSSREPAGAAAKEHESRVVVKYQVL